MKVLMQLFYQIKEYCDGLHCIKKPCMNRTGKLLAFMCAEMQSALWVQFSLKCIYIGHPCFHGKSLNWKNNKKQHNLNLESPS